MTEHKQRNIMPLAVIVLIILAGTIAIISAYNPKKSLSIAPAITSTAAESNSVAKMEAPNDVQVPPASPKAEQKIQLQDIVRLRRSWGPTLTAWYGEDAPDFTLTDITGKEHKLSNYRGKNVIVVFWATWCGPCVAEIPSLITLRSITGEDKLAILAISNEPAERVKNFVTARKINYTVFSYSSLDLSRPYNQVMGIPTSFFITPAGKIKIVTEGMVPFNDIRAILEAE